MSKNSCKITSIGGQALIEGILIRSDKKTAISTRIPDGTISTQYLECSNIKDRYKVFNIPFLRGIASFIDSMKIGYEALSISAQKSGVGDDNLTNTSKFDKWIEKKFGDKIIKLLMVVSSIFGIAVSVLLFFMLPTLIFNFIENLLPFLHGRVMYRSIFEGFFRILIFLLYIVFCSQVNEIRRVFQYHGAEHKTIFCYENNDELKVDNIKKYSRFHPRCGTSFIFLMLIIGIFIGFFIPFSNPLLRTLIKVFCIPVVVGIGYELIKICGRHKNFLTSVISAPGLWIQGITTKEPDDKMIEVAIEALKLAISENIEEQ